MHDVRVAQLEQDLCLARVEVALQQVLRQLRRVRDLYGHLREPKSESGLAVVDSQ